MRGRWSRKAIYAGTVVTVLALVTGFAGAVIYPGGALVPNNIQTGSQSNFANPAGVTILGSYFDIGFNGVEAPVYWVLCNGNPCGPHASEFLPEVGQVAGDIIAVAVVQFNATHGTPSKEVYLIKIGVPGVDNEYFYQYLKTGDATHWLSNSQDTVYMGCDIGTVTVPLGTINVLVYDQGPYV
ncbi:MAG: hypothetical protein L3J97_02515 [Thermoplasmata archaeon]|nr:hypothetical protein [Thermoplasmata archaeon]